MVQTCRIVLVCNKGVVALRVSEVPRREGKDGIGQGAAGAGALRHVISKVGVRRRKVQLQSIRGQSVSVSESAFPVETTYKRGYNINIVPHQESLTFDSERPVGVGPLGLRRRAKVNVVAPIDEGGRGHGIGRDDAELLRGHG